MANLHKCTSFYFRKKHECGNIVKSFSIVKCTINLMYVFHQEDERNKSTYRHIMKCNTKKENVYSGLPVRD